MFLGTIRDYGFRHSKKSKISNDAKSAIVFDYVFHHLGMKTLNTSIEIFHDGRCGRCGRQLTDPTSVETGLGPYCRKK